jgi:hypothetical protein
VTSANYTIDERADGWTVTHDGDVTGPYDTREAAFEAALGPASNAIKLGYAVSITVAAPSKNTSALGSATS